MINVLVRALRVDQALPSQYAAVVENQAERNRWMKVAQDAHEVTHAPQIKDYSDQVSVLTSVAVERFLTPWEEQRVKELVLAMLEELKAERRGVAQQIVPPAAAPVRAVSPQSGAAQMSMAIEPKAEPGAPHAPRSAAHSNVPVPAAAAVTEVPPPKKRGRKPMNRVQQQCKSCKTTSTPEWRKGPDGRNSLCNACGLRWSKAVRPDGSTSPGSARGKKQNESKKTAAADDASSVSIDSSRPSQLQDASPPAQLSSSVLLPQSQPPAAAGLQESAPLAVSLSSTNIYISQSVGLQASREEEERTHAMNEELRSEDHLLNHEEVAEGEKMPQ